MTERERFERYWPSPKEVPIKVTNGFYEYEADLREVAWEVWQAAVEGYKEELEDLEKRFDSQGQRILDLSAMSIKQDIDIDRAYADGLQAGWNYACNDDWIGFQEAKEHHREHILKIKQALQNKEEL